ncbi:biotin--[acetyl-CoA-carboxylase] ligase [Prevotella sp. AGR2160]|uniref:biotin--[acetyl-CoA-carboxylase] ligase n=1 Tax=Prevotella sp. AGR2160 TaxID=1280674 RepID=UPI0004296E63|nr:biotin--[acetyl-CoA-carboxylase] ligase [Prevotella sp. AGR2160]
MRKYTIKRKRLNETDSTNNYLNAHLADFEGTDIAVVETEFQSAGRGQGTNTWESEKGENLLFSILCHPVGVPVREQFIVSMATALTLRDVLTQYTDGISIKWPNDIYYHDQKISGTLIETHIRKGQISDCILGIGIDVNQKAFHSDAPNPVSLYQILGREVNREEILLQIIDKLQHYLTMIEENRYQEIIDLYMSYLYRGTGFWPFRDSNGDFEAAIVEVEDDGHLVLRDRSDRFRSYLFKEVQFML